MTKFRVFNLKVILYISKLFFKYLFLYKITFEFIKFKILLISVVNKYQNFFLLIILYYCFYNKICCQSSLWFQYVSNRFYGVKICFSFERISHANLILKNTNIILLLEDFINSTLVKKVRQTISLELLHFSLSGRKTAAINTESTRKLVIISMR